ncbi:hypothetical protein Zmor_009589 [Zophobas morio]|uniref:Uncharacterized protein n=1 Tax=Zophobas morio TaxID=2755281 RepID=A0AA38IQX2_9CUCU|nr:hypothetical protein Zmor_009589 [Zophobas morio]
MSGRPRTTSFAEGNKQPLNPPLGGVKISSKCAIDVAAAVGYGVSAVAFNMARPGGGPDRPGGPGPAPARRGARHAGPRRPPPAAADRRTHPPRRRAKIHGRLGKSARFAKNRYFGPRIRDRRPDLGRGAASHEGAAAAWGRAAPSPCNCI